MDNVKLIRDVLKMHCLLRVGAWDCIDEQEGVSADKCAECLAKHLINHGVNVRPAVPGCDNQYTIAEMAFHNGERRMKDRMVDMILGMQVEAGAESHGLMSDILKRVREL